MVKIWPERIVEANRDHEWLDNGSLFKRSFLGQSVNAGLTEIMNPEILEFTIDRRTRELVALTGFYIEGRICL